MIASVMGLLLAAQASSTSTVIATNETTALCIFATDGSVPANGADLVALYFPQGSTSAPANVEVIDPSRLLQGASLVKVVARPSELILTSKPGGKPWIHISIMKDPSDPRLFAATGDVNVDGGDRIGTCDLTEGPRARVEFDYYRSKPQLLVRRK